MKHHITEHKLPSGAQGLVIDVPGSNVVNMQVRFNSGFQFADPKRYEVPHVLEHVVATVTKKHPGPNEFHIDAQRNGAYVNAFTSADANGYVYEFAEFELNRIVGLIDEQMTEPLFNQTALTAELGNVREELTRNLTQHGNVCAIMLSEKAYPHLWKGYEERIQQLPSILPEHLSAYHTRTHTAHNARFFAAGPFPDGGTAVAQHLEKAFARLEPGSRFKRSGEIGLNLPEALVAHRDIEQLYYRIALFLGELSEAEKRAVTLLRMVLVGGMGSRILGEARRRGLAYSVGGIGHTEPGNSSFGFAGYVTMDNAGALFDLIARQYAAVRQGQLTETELAAAKDLIIGSVQRSTQTVGDLENWYVDPYDESGEIRNFDETLEELRHVPLRDVVAVAQKASDSDRRGMSFVGPLAQAQADDFAKRLEPLW